MGVRGHKGVKTKPNYSFFNLISKSNNKAPEKLVKAYAVSLTFMQVFENLVTCMLTCVLCRALLPILQIFNFGPIDHL